MNSDPERPKWALPYSSPLPEEARKRKQVKLARVAAYVLAFAALIAPAVLFQGSLLKRARKAADYDRRAAAGQLRPGQKRPDAGKGALVRWRRGTYNFWRGQNIYSLPPEGEQESATAPAGAAVTQDDVKTHLHPNMPFVVILFSAPAYLSFFGQMLLINLLKVAAVASAVLMAARVVNHDGRRIPDWVLGLGLLWAIRSIIGDIQHGNTNCFVLFAVTLQLWLYRRGRDAWAGAALALGICLKLTPTLFLAYWLYQRNWKLLGGTAAALAVMMVLIPLLALGPATFGEYTGTWMENLVAPGLVRNAWFPTHVNQSINGVAARYFLSGREGNITWDPDADPYYTKTPPGWITIVELPQGALAMIVRSVQVAIVALMAWAVGWRKLPRDDGRRALHYALIVLGMMLLNQRTWDHHAAVLLIAPIAVWHAIAFGRVSKWARIWSLVLMLVAACCIYLKSAEIFRAAAKLLGRNESAGEQWGNVVEAYGPTFYYFVLTFAAAVVLTVALRRRREPYAEVRQRLGE